MEKPIGHDLPSCREVNEVMGSIFDEDRIFRVDHYLGKETVQNLLALRFGNMLFEPLWNNHAIEHVQITVAEQVGLDERVPHYNGLRSLKDLVQHPFLQLPTVFAWEPPATGQSSGTEKGCL